MRSIWKTAGVLAMAMAFSACSDQAFLKDYEAVKARTGRADLLAGLVDLDQKYPNQLALKVDLGAAYLAQGSQQALAYLSRGEALAASSSDDALKSVLWSNLALYHLAHNAPDEALRYADKALEYKGESLGVVFTRAKARLLKNDAKGALADFQTGWDTRRSTMSPQDFGLFAKTLMSDGRFGQALDVLEAYRQAYPYEVGTGLVESLCYEKLGRPDESVLAAWVDVIYQEAHGMISDTQVRDNVRQLQTKLKSPVLSSISSWLAGEWAKVVVDDKLFEVSADARLLRLSAVLESGRASDAQLGEYSALEDRFRTFPSYYVPLLHHFRDVQKDVRNDGYIALAEKVINLAPQGPEAPGGRQALALGYGLDLGQAPALLTKAEVDAALSNQDLASVLKLLGTPDNPSVQYAVDRLRALAATPAVHEALSKVLAGSSGRIKERLNYVLQAR